MVDYRIHGIPPSVVRKEDTNRDEIVIELIQKFENHPNRAPLMEDLNLSDMFLSFWSKVE